MADSVIVTVNDKTLTRGAASQMARQMAARQGIPPQMLEQFMAQAGGQLLQQATAQFVDQTLMEAEAERRNIEVSEADVDAAIGTLSERLPEGMTLNDALSAQGMTEQSLREDVAKSERLRKLYESESAVDAPVTDEQVQSFYEENPEQFEVKEGVSARHILITCDDKEDEDAHAKAKAEAEAIRKELAEGADFAETAKAKSDCPSSERGGDLGTFGKGQMVPAFEQAAFSQDIGEVGPVIQTPFGYHIVEVTEKVDAATTPLDDVDDQIRDHLQQQAKNEQFAVFLSSLREGADIQYAEGVEAPTR